MDLIFFLAVFIAGGFLAVQGPMNGGLTKNFGRHQFTTVSFVFLIGSVFLFIIFLLSGANWPSWAEQTTRWWHWTGGILGACYVASITFATPQIGAAFTMSLVLLGRVAFSISIDQFGWVGAATRASSWPRLLGVVLVLIGSMLVGKQKPAQSAPAPTVESPK